MRRSSFGMMRSSPGRQTVSMLTVDTQRASAPVCCVCVRNGTQFAVRRANFEDRGNTHNGIPRRPAMHGMQPLPGRGSGTKHGPTRVAIRTFVPGAHYHGPVRPSPKRCDKCGGHLYLDEVELMFGHTPATESAP